MIQVGIGGHFINIIKDMYEKVTYSVKCKGSFLTMPITTLKGLKQGGVLSPNLFNIYLYDLPEKFITNISAPVTLHDTKVGCMLYADDLVMLSESESGLQASLDILAEYCQKWQLTVNLSKSKVIIFNKSGKLINKEFMYNKSKLDIVKVIVILA